MKHLIFWLSLFSVVLMGCESNQSPDTEQQQTTPAPPPPPPAPKVKLTPAGNGTSFVDAELKGYQYADKKFAFDVANYDLGTQTPDAAARGCANSGKGQHIHYILDNAPYKAKYVAEFEEEVPEGDHYLLAFLSRSYHESIKNGKAFIAEKVTVVDGKIKSTQLEDPFLFYSRPKGQYVKNETKNDIQKVLLDFFLVNTTIAPDGNKVKVTVNGKDEFTIDNWQPYFLENLPVGKNTVKLELVDASGTAIENPILPITREFMLIEEPAVR